MNENEKNALDAYYEHIMHAGYLQSKKHAERWSAGVLKTLGTALDRQTRRSLAKDLPEELANSLTAVFWLAHFRDPNQTTAEFCSRAGRRSGNSNGEFAIHPTIAVFGGVKNLIDDDLNDRVAQSLSPEVRNLWNRAEVATIKS